MFNHFVILLFESIVIRQKMAKTIFPCASQVQNQAKKAPEK
jgi:hypothetical protein